MTRLTRRSYADTLAFLSDAINASGNTIFATIDQSAAAASAGLSLRPTTLVLFGNPKAGTPLMEAVPLAALELPLKFLVWEERGETSVAWVPLSEIAARYGVTGMDDRIAAIDTAVTRLAEAAT